MATVRRKKGKKTKGQDGDIGAIDPIGEPFIRFCTLELKRGYSSDTVHALLDKHRKAKHQTYEHWFAKCRRQKESAGSYSWMLITKRNQREALVFMPYGSATKLETCQNALSGEHTTKGSRLTSDLPVAVFTVELDGVSETVFCARLESFLENVAPQAVRDLLESGGVLSFG